MNIRRSCVGYCTDTHSQQDQPEMEFASRRKFLCPNCKVEFNAVFPVVNGQCVRRKHLTGV